MLFILYSFSVLALYPLHCTADIVDLGIPKSLDSTQGPNITIPFTNLVNLTNALGTFRGCYQQPPPSEPQLCRTNFADCFNAQEKIAAYDTYKPVRFSRHENSSIELPITFTYRSCLIFLDMVSADAEDFFRVGEIRGVAIDTARRCTALRRALGGMGLAGPRQLMEVLVLGRPWPFGDELFDTVAPDGDDAVA